MTIEGTDDESKQQNVAEKHDLIASDDGMKPKQNP